MNLQTLSHDPIKAFGNPFLFEVIKSCGHWFRVTGLHPARVKDMLQPDSAVRDVRGKSPRSSRQASRTITPPRVDAAYREVDFRGLVTASSSEA